MYLSRRDGTSCGFQKSVFSLYLSVISFGTFLVSEKTLLFVKRSVFLF